MERVILFDGVCNLCNTSVQFVIKRDRKARFKFAPLQGELGRRVLAENNLPSIEFHSFVLLENGRMYQKSTAALRVAKALPGLWPLLYYVFILVPPFIRNTVYTWVAGNRYKWFGKQEACMVPTPELKSRFIG